MSTREFAAAFTAVVRYSRGEGDTKAAVLNEMMARDKAFPKWLRDYLGDENEFKEAWADEGLRADYFGDYLDDEHQIRVRGDGLVTFYNLTPKVERLIGDLPVAVYHHTSDSLDEKIRREGLRADRKRSNPHQNSGTGVYVTTENSGPVVSGYIDNATQTHRGGGRTWTIRTRLADLSPDPDDEDLSSGGRQFVLPHVPPHDLVEAD